MRTNVFSASRFVTFAIVVTLLCQQMTTANPYSSWKNGPSHDVNFFPICVWLQNPSKADSYKAAGFNTYVGLWKGPTEQ